MDKTREPQRDNRYRVSQSALIYGLNAYFSGRGVTLSFQEAMERTIYLDEVGQAFIVYEGEYLRLQSVEEMRDLVGMVLNSHIHGARIMGTRITDMNQFTPYPFFFLRYDQPRSLVKKNEAKVMRMLQRYRRRRAKQAAV